jgi:hypothetical protein
MNIITNNNNNLWDSEIDAQAFTSFGKVITNKDGIIQIIGLENVVVG